MFYFQTPLSVLEKYVETYQVYPAPLLFQGGWLDTPTPLSTPLILRVICPDPLFFLYWLTLSDYWVTASPPPKY